ncbi:thioredoxin family protein [Tenuifilum thalassicum]|uniref:Thioredoxin family protein n=1 Tax=Tenuifilum thalassicum TaxID=2590900 RepID=A0A7D3XJR1_9BACT|nr:thioredoxin family protein [Tenuifilum thalassicum]QKG79150.1 thioredoxin family protein [Tenuifilum thalassicum]
MKNKIEILSPGRNCRRTQKIANSIKGILKAKHVDFDLEIISNHEEFKKYKTWILPTVNVNDSIVARGYNPPKEILLKNIK